MSSQHTPLPWYHQGLETEGEERGSVSIIGSDLGGLVGVMLPWPTELDSGDFSRVLANADLVTSLTATIATLRAENERLAGELAECGKSWLSPHVSVAWMAAMDGAKKDAEAAQSEASALRERVEVLTTELERIAYYDGPPHYLKELAVLALATKEPTK